MATLTRALVQLRSEFNEISPGRDKGSDGWIGNASHQAGISDHNPDESGNAEVHDADHVDEVHAIDVDKDLRRAGWTMALVVAFLVARCRAGIEKRLRYIIFNRVIWSASSGWKARAYTGSNPHDKHAHFSGSYVTALESNTNRFHLELAVPDPHPGTPSTPVPLPRKAQPEMLMLIIDGDKTIWLSFNGRERVSLSQEAQRWTLQGGGVPAPIVVKDETELTYIGGPERKTV